jgi:hypothetical protein
MLAGSSLPPFHCAVMSPQRARPRFCHVSGRMGNKGYIRFISLALPEWIPHGWDIHNRFCCDAMALWGRPAYPDRAVLDQFSTHTTSDAHRPIPVPASPSVKATNQCVPAPAKPAKTSANAGCLSSCPVPSDVGKRPTRSLSRMRRGTPRRDLTRLVVSGAHRNHLQAFFSPPLRKSSVLELKSLGR